MYSDHYCLSGARGYYLAKKSRKDQAQGAATDRQIISPPYQPRKRKGTHSRMSTHDRLKMNLAGALACNTYNMVVNNYQ